jgi:hypothetical protein
MDAILVMDPAGSKTYTFDFSPVLPATDSSLSNIGTGDSTIDAYKYDGTDVGSTILSSKTRTGKTLIVTIGALTLGQEYRVRFIGEGATSGQKFTMWLQVLCRNEGEAEL